MTKILALSPDQHGHARWIRPNNHLQQVATALIAVSLMELPDIVASIPVAFVEQEGEVHLVAVLSPMPARNMFIGPSGEWLGTYIPVAFRLYPFVITGVPGTNNLVLGFDEDSGCLSADAHVGEPFFEADGALSPVVKAASEILVKAEHSRVATSAAARALRDAGVLVPWPVKIDLGDREVENAGLLRVDESALNTLPEEAFMQLRTIGALPIAYLQLISMRNFGVFHKLDALQKQLYARLSEQIQAVPADPTFSMDEFLAQHGGQSLKFD